MCSGKTRVGKDLADAIGHAFRDIDRVIEARVGPITPWFRTHGEAAFREVERTVLGELLGAEHTVIACGGGTPVAFDNMDRALRAGTVLFLDVPLDVLVARCLRAGRDRPLLFGLDDEQLALRVRTLLEERSDIYGRAHHRIPAGGAPAEVLDHIRRVLRDQER